MSERDLGSGELPQVNTRAVVLATAGILLALVTIAFGLQLLFHDRSGTSVVMQQPFPSPGVTPNERTARRALDAEQQAQLKGAGGRMPIDDAMKAVAARGERAFDPLNDLGRP